MKSRIVTVALLALVAVSLSACVGRARSGTDTFVDSGQATDTPPTAVAATGKAP